MSKIKTLVVDDEPYLLDLTRIFLERHNDISVSLACSAKEALAMIDTEEFDVVVSDYQMPIMDGLQLLKSLKEKKRDLPFILFTGKGRESVAVDALNLGASFYLQKGGDPESQLIMGHAYLEGVGVLKDHRMAIEMLKKAAEKDHPIAPIAQYTLGAAYHEGIMVPLDFAESLKWTRKSAEAGYDLAQHLLAEMYKFGEGVGQSYTEAFTLYYRAALKGHPDSQYQVGLFHHGGKGCAKNENIALNWLRCAAAQGHQDSKEVLVELQLRSLYPQKRHRQWPLE